VCTLRVLHRALEITQHALVLMLTLSLPALLAAALVGVVVGLFSAATQIQDSTLSFLPRLVAVALVILVLGGAGAGAMVRFTAELWRAIPTLVR